MDTEEGVLINLFAKDYGPKVLAQEFNRFEVINCLSN